MIFKGSFRDHNPVTMGIAGMVTTALLVILAFNLTFFEGGTTYHAAFTEASGLKPDEDVRIAGVKVGKVDGVGLEGDHVKVTFHVNGDVHFGTLSKVNIKISNILGSHYLEVEPGGTQRQSPHQEIPTSRTAPSYEVVPALQDLSSQVTKIDIPQLGKAFDTLADTLQYSPENVRRTLVGLQKISRAIASRDDSLNSLLGHSKNVTQLLADRSGDLAALVSDSGLLLQEINKRRQVVGSLLSGTVSLSQQITATINENQATLHPAMVQLHNVIKILERNQSNLEQAIRVVGPFVATSGDATASGRWFDGYLQNLIPIPVSIQPPGWRPPKPTQGMQGKRKPSPTTAPSDPGTLPIFK